MPTFEGLTLTPRWDLACVPIGEAVDRGLLIDIKAPASARTTQRLPVNLALVLDRSGSMSGRPLQAVIEAVCGVIGGMGDEDRLAVVTFDNEVETVLPPCAMTPDAREQARARVRAVEPRGSTDLAGGWFRGAECATEMLAEAGARHAHVVILSDGQANRGLQDPQELAEHAAALAARGITTSSVGVGRNYSAAQLDALARGGEGRLNHCDHGEDIVDVILGELLDEREMVAQELTVTLRADEGVELTLLSELPHDELTDGLRIRVGNLRTGGTRSLALLATPAGMEAGAEVRLLVDAQWRRAEDGGVESAQTVVTRLRAVTEEELDAAERDFEVAERILDLWEASVIYRGTQLHASGDYSLGSAVVSEAEDRIGSFSRGTKREKQRHTERVRFSRSVGDANWDDAASRTAMDLSRKAMLQHADRRRDLKGSWRDKG